MAKKIKRFFVFLFFSLFFSLLSGQVEKPASMGRQVKEAKGMRLNSAEAAQCCETMPPCEGPNGPYCCGT